MNVRLLGTKIVMFGLPRYGTAVKASSTRPGNGVVSGVFKSHGSNDSGTD
ncbi:hypothetical protein FVEN_g13209 [Fusarium venenatum]|nr:hypothetical protein FVEN_g13209 [Fusarium venenatum]